MLVHPSDHDALHVPTTRGGVFGDLMKEREWRRNKGAQVAQALIRAQGILAVQRTLEHVKGFWQYTTDQLLKRAKMSSDDAQMTELESAQPSAPALSLALASSVTETLVRRKKRRHADRAHYFTDSGSRRKKKYSCATSQLIKTCCVPPATDCKCPPRRGLRRRRRRRGRRRR